MHVNETYQTSVREYHWVLALQLPSQNRFRLHFVFKFSEYSISSIQTGFSQVFDTSDSSSGPTPIKPDRCWDCWDLYDMLITASAPCQVAHLSMEDLAMTSTCDCRDLWTCPKNLWCQTVKITFLFPWNATWVDHFQLSFEQLGHAKWPRAVWLGETRGTMRCWGGGCRQRSGYVRHVHVDEFRPQKAHTDVANRGTVTEIFPTLALTKATQIIGNNRHCHSFGATTAFSCLHHKPRSWHALHKRCWGTKSQDPAAVSTSPEQIRNVANVHATCKPPKSIAGWHCQFFWEATEVKV